MAAYGRLDVYWPDGPIESYPLDKPTVAIGRSSGNDIPLDTTAVSRYHISLTLKGEQVVLEDLESINGTYVDGVRLPPHETRPLKGGEEIQIGDIRLIYHPMSDAAPGDDTTMQRAQSEQPTFKVEVDDTDQAVTPGAHNQTVVNVQNIGEELDRYIIQVEGLPKDWVRLDRAEMELAPGVRSQIVLSFKPIRRSDSKPGEYLAKVIVASRNHANQMLEVPIRLHVLSYSGFGIVLATPRVQAGEPFEIYTHNQGSAPLALAVVGADPGGLFSFEIQPETITLAAGEKRTVRGNIRPKRANRFGRAGEYRFDIIARARDASGFQAPVSGVYVEKTGLPPWLPLLLIPLVIVGALIVLLGGSYILGALQPAATAAASATALPTFPQATVTTVMIAIPTFTPIFVATETPPLPPTIDETQRALDLQATSIIMTVTAAAPGVSPGFFVSLTPNQAAPTDPTQNSIFAASTRIPATLVPFTIVPTAAPLPSLTPTLPLQDFLLTVTAAPRSPSETPSAAPTLIPTIVTVPTQAALPTNTLPPTF